MVIIGIDPGKTGGVGYFDSEKRPVVFPVEKLTAKDLVDEIKNITAFDTAHCVIENVHAMPRQGVRSMFNFGKNFGFYLGVLTALAIPYEFVTPGYWQKSLGCLTKGDKNVTKAKAQQLFPQLKITHATADAILIAYYGLQKLKGENR